MIQTSSSEECRKPQPPLLLKEVSQYVAIRLQFVLQYFWCPEAPRKGNTVSTPPICIAVRLPFVSQCFWESLGGCGHRDVPTSGERRGRPAIFAALSACCWCVSRSSSRLRRSPKRLCRIALAAAGKSLKDPEATVNSQPTKSGPKISRTHPSHHVMRSVFGQKCLETSKPVVWGTRSLHPRFPWFSSIPWFP